jgi:hypothetical protein
MNWTFGKRSSLFFCDVQRKRNANEENVYWPTVKWRNFLLNFSCL